MLTRKLLPLSAMVLALGLSGLTTHVNATDNTYGNGAIITVPKKMQGTWYSYDRNAHNGRKITFTAHTVNGKIIYYNENAHLWFKILGYDVPNDVIADEMFYIGKYFVSLCIIKN